MTNENMSQDQKTQVPAIYEAMAKIMSETAAIEKQRHNTDQNFDFRGVDDVYNAMHPILARHKVFMLPGENKVTRETRDSRRGGKLIFTVIEVKWFYVSGEDGSMVAATATGESMDSGDKGVNKAMSHSHKNCLLRTFLIPTMEPDGDEVSPEAMPPQELISESEYNALLEDMESYGVSLEFVENYLRRQQIDSLKVLPKNLLGQLSEKFPAMGETIKRKSQQNNEPKQDK